MHTSMQWFPSKKYSTLIWKKMMDLWRWCNKSLLPNQKMTTKRNGLPHYNLPVIITPEDPTLFNNRYKSGLWIGRIFQLPEWNNHIIHQTWLQRNYRGRHTDSSWCRHTVWKFQKADCPLTRNYAIHNIMLSYNCESLNHSVTCYS